MTKATKAGRKVLLFPLPKPSAESQAKQWIDGVLKSNGNLRMTLELLRDSYCALLAGSPAKDAEEILAQVEAILKGAEAAHRCAF